MDPFVKPRMAAAAWYVLPVVILILILQAYHPLWRGHLQVDVVTFQLRAAHFLEQYSWAGLDYNEYQPGALWFFVLVGLFTAALHNFDAFVTATVLVNAALIVAHFYFFVRYGPRYAPLTFLVIVLATGPILLYRFELLVSLVVLFAWLSFRHRNVMGAAFLLGIAAAIKIYPVVLLPLLVTAAVRQRVSAGVHTGLAFAAGVAVPVGSWLAWGGTGAALFAGINFHHLKPVGLDGIWGVLITLIQRLADMPLRITPGYGVHGLTSDLPLLTNSFLDSLWILPAGLLFIALLWFFRRRGLADPGCAFALLLVFVVFSKVLNPQYLWWFAVFLPWLSPAWWSPLRWRVVLSTVALGLLLTQLIYPLYYTEYLAWFNQPGGGGILFFVSVVRNGLLLLLLGLTVAGMRRQARTETDGAAPA